MYSMHVLHMAMLISWAERFCKPEAASASCRHESDCNHMHTQCLSILLFHLAPLKKLGLPLVTGAFASASPAINA
jgi:hypothetical protein